MKIFNYTDEMREFLQNNTYGRGNAELTELFNKEFNTNINIGRIKSYKKNHNLSSGLTGRFPKGNIPHNKGTKGKCAPGCEKTWFPKGHIPANYKPIGSERLSKRGYVEIKTRDANRWEPKHRFIYAREYGVIPKNHIVVFLDQNKNNFHIDNLKLVSKSELLLMNKHSMVSNNAQITDCSINVAKLMIAMSNAKKTGQRKL